MKNTAIKYIQIKLASPQDILTWSHGEVKKAETINYRTHRAEPDGLMCEKIFGPTKDYECFCGKYKKVKYKGVICDKCGVEVTSKIVRRERMGHIRLAAPVTHVWFMATAHQKISLLLDIPHKKLLAVVYFSRYLVVESDPDAKQDAIVTVEEELASALQNLDQEVEKEINKKKQELEEKVKEIKAKNLSEEEADFLIDELDHKLRIEIAKLKEESFEKRKKIEKQYQELKDLVSRLNVGETMSEEERILLEEKNLIFFDYKIGAEAVQYLLKKINLEELAEELKKDTKSKNLQRRVKALARLRLVQGFIRNKIRPEWMVLEVLPVLPADLRPIVQISGGRFATADLNELYRRVINRNNRLKRLIDIGAPEIILRNEKRMLQEAVDSLLDNEHKQVGAVVVNKRKMPLKSLSENLRGKEGRFRQNLLGKRVDYSGRSVIVGAGRDLNLNQVGIPKHMALELFKPFVIYQLIERGHASNVRSAKNILEQSNPPEFVWNILADVTHNHPVMINRAPTLHKQSIQGYYPVLVDGDAIRIHPLITEGYNADFDGDQMAVHVPLSPDAIEEVKTKMFTQQNLLNAGSGDFLFSPRMSLVHALYYLTYIEGEKPYFFSNPKLAITAYEQGKVGLRDKIKVLIEENILDTTVGRILFNELLPERYPFVNALIDRKAIRKIYAEMADQYTADEIVQSLDKVIRLGFDLSTKMGVTIGSNDLVEPEGIKELIAEGIKKTQELNYYSSLGLLTDFDKSMQFSKLWLNEIIPNVENIVKSYYSQKNSALKEIADSGARFSYDVISQLVGAKGLVFDINQKIVELPIKSNYSRGFPAFEYFVSAKGSRKGLADTALRTADAGYLTRKLCEVSHDVLVREEDCKSEDGIWIRAEDDVLGGLPFVERIRGRVLQADVVHEGNIIATKGQMIDRSFAKRVVSLGINEVFVRSPLTCKTLFGVCQQCYGLDYSTNDLVEIGKSVGIISGQAVGAPATQLVLNTKHKSGAASASGDITMGLPRVTELFEARIPKGVAIISEIGGQVSIKKDDVNKQYQVTVTNTIVDVVDYSYTDEDRVMIKPRTRTVKAGDLLIIKANGEEIRSTRSGKVSIKPDRVLVETTIQEQIQYKVSYDQELLVSDGDTVEPGTPITMGNIDPRLLLQTKGLLQAQLYIIQEVKKVYSLQGINIADKMFEVLVAQMGRYVKVEDPGDTNLVIGEIRDKHVIRIINNKLRSEGKKEIRYSEVLLGITQASLKTESFLSAASFQEQVRVLTDVSIMGKKDYLIGLKENVIMGRKIPVDESARINPDELDFVY